MNIIVLSVGIVAVVGIAAGILLTVAAKFMSVPVDERVSNVRAVLPGANCGACGFAGCDEYAAKLVSDGVKSNLCTPGGSSVAKQISELLGGGFEEVEVKTAVVKCSGEYDKTSYKLDYEGPRTCEANNMMFSGRGKCAYACLGYGDCVSVCQYNAISVENGIAVVNKDLCTACGMCVAQCPKRIIEIIPAKSEVVVFCSSHDNGAVTRKACSAGCIACKKCEKECEYGAITVTDNLAKVDYAKCTNCGKCIEVCPTKVIKHNLYSGCEA